MTFETDDIALPGEGSVSKGASSVRLGSIEQYLRLRPRWCAELEAPGRSVRVWMMEDVQRLRPLIVMEDELEIVVGRGIGDGDRHQFRSAAPEEPHRDAVALA